MVSNPSLSFVKTIKVFFEGTPLTVYIKGGNIMHNYKEALSMEGVVKNLDVDIPL